ncbi:MAG: glycosyltransferase [Pyrinomonadaceae bacterium]
MRSLRSIGIDARGFTTAPSEIQSSDEITVFPFNKGGRLIKGLRQVFAYGAIRKMIEWADILHWVSDANIFASGRYKNILSQSDKPGVVQWIGSDIRIPEIDRKLNPYYQNAADEGYEYRFESLARSKTTLRFFSDLGFYPLEFIGMGHYIDHDLFPKRFRTWQSVVVADFEPSFPSKENKRPIIVHSPSAPVAKGTRHVLATIENLKEKYDLDFVLVENTQRDKALDIMRGCDIYVDQLILGAHGYAAVEAMAFGKPVVCYINSEIGKDYPDDLPLINANPDDIEKKLELLIRDATFRHETGKKSREYVEKYHDDKKIAHDLVDIYKEVIDLRAQGKPTR